MIIALCTRMLSLMEVRKLGCLALCEEGLIICCLLRLYFPWAFSFDYIEGYGFIPGLLV